MEAVLAVVSWAPRHTRPPREVAMEVVLGWEEVDHLLHLHRRVWVIGVEEELVQAVFLALRGQQIYPYQRRGRDIHLRLVIDIRLLVQEVQEEAEEAGWLVVEMPVLVQGRS